jgi:hypothetical protein
MTALQQFFTLVRRNPVVSICTALVILLGAASYFLWQSQQQLSVGHDSVRRNGEDMLLSLSGLPRVSSELNSVKEAVDFIDANLIREGDLAENLGYLYQLETISIPFSIRASGSYRQVMRFLHELETGPRLCRITTYSLSGGEDDRVGLDLTIEMLGRP